jgi:3-phytase
MIRVLVSVFILALAGACALGPRGPVVDERYVTTLDPAMNIDSVASWTADDGTSWLFATAKDGHLLRIYDAATGETLRDLGGPGTGPGEFQRPNGVLVVDDLLVVVERDNRRIQVLGLPGLDSLARFGDAALERPYGAWLQPLGNDRYRLYVTDAYELANERRPPDEELDRRVKWFTLEVERDAADEATAVNANYEGAFGETVDPGMLYVVESIWGDTDNDRLFIAEEDPAGGRVIKPYSLDGRYTGPLIGDGVFRSQPEGIALYACDDGSGYWITTDQAHGRNVFHIFERDSLAHVGGFEGAVTRNTDGIWLNQAPLEGFPAGAFFAVHDDQAASAFDWRDIVAALGLRPGC